MVRTYRFNGPRLPGQKKMKRQKRTEGEFAGINIAKIPTNAELGIPDNFAIKQWRKTRKKK